MVLPEQQYFTLAELIERWSTTERRVLELILNRELDAVALVSTVATSTRQSENGNTSEITTTHQLEVRTWFDPELLFCLFKDGIGMLSEYVEDGEWIRFASPVTITKGELLVTREELQRFERAHSANQEQHPTNAESEDATTAPTDSELKRTQRTLAALVLGLAEKYPGYRAGEKPNASQIARLATEHLRDADSDRTPHGFSETTVRQTIAAAIKACPELSE
ncbi:hypothetical protein [Marinobacter sp. NFXS9]|uniref:hypothetical protein n=1 Tax=Marinobacter sp. NFXS9 TaxID=2818433 RepID=UPI0032DF578B